MRQPGPPLLKIGFGDLSLESMGLSPVSAPSRRQKTRLRRSYVEYLDFRTEVLRIFLEMTPPGLFLGLTGFYQYDHDRRHKDTTPHSVGLRFAVQTIHDPSFLKRMLYAKARVSMRPSVKLVAVSFFPEKHGLPLSCDNSDTLFLRRRTNSA